MSDDVAALFAEKVVIVNGEEIHIRPFNFVECMTSAAKYARSFAGSLSTGSVLDIVADGGEDILKLVQLAVKKPRDWWDSLPADSGLELIAAVLEVNRAFFVERLQGPLQSLVKAVGERSSPDSSGPATGGPTSSNTP